MPPNAVQHQQSQQQQQQSALSQQHQQLAAQQQQMQQHSNMQQRYAAQQVPSQIMIQQNTPIGQQNHQIYGQQTQNLIQSGNSGGIGPTQQIHSALPSGNSHQQYIHQQQMFIHQQQMGGSMMQVNMHPMQSGMQPIMGIIPGQQQQSQPSQQSVAAHIQQQTHQLSQNSQVENVCFLFIFFILKLNKFLVNCC